MTHNPPHEPQDVYASSFSEAEEFWNLEKLYADLTEAKEKYAGARNRQRLTAVEKACLRGLLSGHSPDGIAKKLIWRAKALSVELSRGLYRYVETLTDRNANEIRNWRNIAEWLEAAGYKTRKRGPDWGDAPDVSLFYGRTKELETLEQWIVRDRCRLVALLGRGGMGKTFLSVKLAEKLRDNFQYVIWRSLSLAPSLTEVLADMIRLLSRDRDAPAETVDGMIRQLIDYFSKHRCLVILDEVETILRAGQPSGIYREGYEDYGHLLKRVGEGRHQSCLVLTSREQPQEIKALASKKGRVRELQLKGLEYEEARALLSDCGFSINTPGLKGLFDCYKGHPLVLRMTSRTIIEMHNGNIAEFLEGTVFVHDLIIGLLDQQFLFLSDLENRIMPWLASPGELVSLKEVREKFVSSKSGSKTDITQALENLVKRSLVEKKTSAEGEVFFTLEPVVRKYVTKRFGKGG